MNLASGTYELRVLKGNAEEIEEKIRAAQEAICEQKKSLEEVVRAFNDKLHQLIEDELKARNLDYCSLGQHFATGEIVFRVTEGSRQSEDGEIRFHRLHRICPHCDDLLATDPDKVIPGVKSLNVQQAMKREGNYFLSNGQQLGGTVTIAIDFVSKDTFSAFAAGLGLPTPLYVMEPETEPSLGGGEFPKTATQTT